MNNILNKLKLDKNKILLIGIILIVLIGIPLTILQSQKEQDIRQRATGKEVGKVSLGLECQSQDQLICEDIEVNDEFSVEIHLKNEKLLDISAFMFTINYDSNLLTLSGFRPELTKFNPPIINESSVLGVVQYAAVNPDPTTKITNDNILIGTLDFKAISESTGGVVNLANSQVTSSTKKEEALEVDHQDFAFAINLTSEICTPEGKKSHCEKRGFECGASEVCSQRPGTEEGKKSCICYPAAPTPGGVLLDLSLSLETIKPDQKNLPAHVAKSPITIEVLHNLTEEVVVTKDDQIVYDKTDGKFKRILDLGKIPPGEYEVKIKVDKYLKKLVPTIITVIETAPEETQTIALDITTPMLRSVGLLDFGAFVDCYGSKINDPDSCKHQDSADLNFDEVVDIIDGNIVLRNFGKTDD
jgi:hypothetical protein